MPTRGWKDVSQIPLHALLFLMHTVEQLQVERAGLSAHEFASLAFELAGEEVRTAVVHGKRYFHRQRHFERTSDTHLNRVAARARVCHCLVSLLLIAVINSGTP